MSLRQSDMLSEASTILGYRFEDFNWLWEALQAAGSPVGVVGDRTLSEGNKPLAGLGDRIIALLIVKEAVNDNVRIGATNARIQKYASNAYLSDIRDKIGLTRCINGNLAQQGVHSPSTKSATVEAVIGAVFEDGGLEATEKVMKHIGIIV